MNAALARPEFLLLLFVLIFSPLAFGTVEPWSRAIAESAALLGLAVALRRRTREGGLRLYATPGALPLLLFLALPLLQATPLPPALVHLVSPAAHARWSAALGTAGPLPWLTLSLDPLATLREFFRLSACAAVYLLTVQLLARPVRLRVAANVLAVFAAALSFAAILQYLSAPRQLLFIRDSPSQFSFGPFVNRNHYANLMAMLAPVMLGLFLGHGVQGRARSLRGRLVELLARPESGVRLLLGFSALLSASSLVVSLSRGATVAALASLLVFGGCLIAHRLGGKRSVAVALFFYAFTVFVGWFGWEKVADRFSNLRLNPDIVDSVRAGLWRDSVRMSSDFPVLGSGIGSFERLYPAYRTVPGPLAIAHAHNDYLELLAGGGAIGLGLFAWFAAAVLFAAVRACVRRHDQPALYLAFGSLAGCVAFLVHGASDFSFAIGANALYFFFLLGLAVSAAHTREIPDGQRTLLGPVRLPALAAQAVAALALAAVLLHGATLAALHLWNLAAAESRQPDRAQTPPATVERLLTRAALLQPLEPAYPAALARIASRTASPDDALRLTRQALRRLPLDAVSLMQLGTLHSARREDEAARQSFAAAVSADPAAPRHRETYGAWLLSRGDRGAAVSQLREAMLLDPPRAPAVISRLVLAGFADEQIAAAIPPSPAALLLFARYALTIGAEPLAAEAYRRTLALEPGNQQAAAGLSALGRSR